jgi:hypothetical protein
MPWKPANARPFDIAAATVPDTLAALHVNPDTGLTHGAVDVRITTVNPDALAAVHEFLRFQISDHATGDSGQLRNLERRSNPINKVPHSLVANCSRLVCAAPGVVTFTGCLPARL